MLIRSLMATGAPRIAAETIVDLSTHAVKEMGVTQLRIAESGGDTMITAQVLLLSAQLAVEVCANWVNDAVEAAAAEGVSMQVSQPI